MSHITLNIVADSPADLADALNGLVASLLASTAPAAIAPPAAAEEPAAPKTTRRRAAEKSDEGKAPAPSEAAASASTPSATTEASNEQSSAASENPVASSDATKSATYADVQAAVTKLAAKKGRDAVIAVFEQFGVDHGSKLTEAQWPEAIAAMTAALDAEPLA